MLNNKIILLNGASSSGKTTILNYFRNLQNEIWLHWGIDLLWLYILPRTTVENNLLSNRGFKLLNINNKISTVVGDLGMEMLKKSVDIINILGENNNLIIDDVITTKEHLNLYIKHIKLPIFFIHITCDPLILETREIQRKNRTIGLSLSQYEELKHNNFIYDYTLDSSLNNMEELFYKLKNFVENNIPGKIFLN